MALNPAYQKIRDATEQETVNKIRKTGYLDLLSNQQIKNLYRKFSKGFCAQWIESSDQRIKDFIKWYEDIQKR